jgi:hypothetical protein
MLAPVRAEAARPRFETDVNRGAAACGMASERVACLMRHGARTEFDDGAGLSRELRRDAPLPFASGEP